MSPSSAAPSFNDALTGPMAFTRWWAEASSQAGEQTAALTRQTLQAGLLCLEQQAAQTERWFSLLGGTAHGLAQAAQAASGKAARAEDPSAVWGAELELFNESAHLAGTSMQELWTALLDGQSRLAKAMFDSGSDNALRLLHTLEGSGGARDSEVATPAAGNGFGTMFDWMTQAAQQVWQAAAAASAAANGGGAAAEPPAAAPEVGAGRPRRVGSR